ncbi:MAG: ROK family protein [Chryseolinea sp.]
MKEKLAIGIDLGCTNIKGVLVNESGSLLHELKVHTNEHDSSHWKREVTEMISSLESIGGVPISNVGLAAPGLANENNSCISFMPGRLPGLENLDWSKVASRNIHVLNDGHAALMAEAAFGAAKGVKHAVLFSLGTGVGGAVLINGKLYQGALQMAGHLGHITVDANAVTRDVTNMVGSIEDAIGNVSLHTRTYGRYETTDDLVNDYLGGNVLATWWWLSSVQKLSAAIASTINALSPEVVILSGGVTQARDALLKPLQSFLDLYEWRPTSRHAEIRLAHFSDLAGAIGAAGFALSKNNVHDSHTNIS